MPAIRNMPPDQPEFIEVFSPTEMANEYIQLMGYRPTDMQYNIGRTEGNEHGWGYDLIEPESETRVLITEGSSSQSEDLVQAVLGDYATLDRIGNGGAAYSIFTVPEGTRSLIKTLRSAPYRSGYMDRMQEATLKFIIGLHRLDPEIFGIDISRLALTYGQDTDDAHVTLIPPLPIVSGAANTGVESSTDKHTDSKRHIADLANAMRKGKLTAIPNKMSALGIFERWLSVEAEDFTSGYSLTGLLRAIGLEHDPAS